MARKQNSQTEDAGVYSATPMTDEDRVSPYATPPLVQAPPMSTVREVGVVEDVAPPQRYRVLRSQYVMASGGRTILREGKVIDESAYDIPNLRSQGVSLEAL